MSGRLRLVLLTGAAGAIALGAVGCALVGGLGDFQQIDALPAVDGGGGGGGDGGGDETPAEDGQVPPKEYASIGGTVKNLQGSGLILRDNGVDDVLLTQSGPFTFPAKVKTGSTYAVTVGAQPANPTQTCTVSNGSGTVNGADVTDVAVHCATSAYKVGGTVVGLTCGGLVLTNNAGDDLSISQSGAFAFAAKVASGAPYAVAVKTQPSGCGPCEISGGSGTVGGADIGSVVVNCSPGTHTVGGTVSGLVGTVVLQLNGGNDLALTANGSFAFSLPLAPSASYAVTVLTQPSSPRSQTCTVIPGTGTGTVSTANVTSVSITCTTNSFTVGGSVTGLSGSVGLLNNGGDALTVNGSVGFTFNTKIASGNAYSVTVGAQPSGQACTVKNGSGVVGAANVTNVAVSCGSSSTTDPGIKCDAAGYCNAATQVCCRGGGVASTCKAAGTTCAAQTLACDDTADCAAKGGGVCCAEVGGSGTVGTVTCTSLAACTGSSLIVCDPGITGECPNGKSCSLLGSKNMSGYTFCQ